ncbi:hypothetical protein M5K25_016872 [Dendrobium thyrsiflorum]|uniref:Uncharacterized protein n=1 Tax=Dendrobium thyrsiflorum TaxID=117978 RepID=A0ABD0ULA9_DENTH
MIKGINIGCPFKPLPTVLDLSTIYWPCHSKKFINRVLITHGRDGGGRDPREEEKEEEKLEFSCHQTPPQPPPDFHTAVD